MARYSTVYEKLFSEKFSETVEYLAHQVALAAIFSTDSCSPDDCGSNDTTYMVPMFLDKKSTPEGTLFEDAPFSTSIYQLDSLF